VHGETHPYKDIRHKTRGEIRRLSREIMHISSYCCIVVPAPFHKGCVIYYRTIEPPSLPKSDYFHVRFESLTEVTVESTNFLYIARCSMVEIHRLPLSSGPKEPAISRPLLESSDCALCSLPDLPFQLENRVTSWSWALLEKL
jgi:hypothetical protein